MTTHVRSSITFHLVSGIITPGEFSVIDKIDENGQRPAKMECGTCVTIDYPDSHSYSAMQKVLFLP